VKFWDTSGVVSLCVSEPVSQLTKAILRSDEAMVVWWATRLECISAIVRRTREGILDARSEELARTVLASLTGSWSEVLPTQSVREIAERLLAVHPLRAADALQLAAALEWCRGRPRKAGIVSFDLRLRDAARKEGFSILPTKWSKIH
jgi:predicted nucleic acid-binding protein